MLTCINKERSKTELKRTQNKFINKLLTRSFVIRYLLYALLINYIKFYI